MREFNGLNDLERKGSGGNTKGRPAGSWGSQTEKREEAPQSPLYQIRVELGPEKGAQGSNGEKKGKGEKRKKMFYITRESIGKRKIRCRVGLAQRGRLW